MKESRREKRIDQFFRISILLKGIHALLEIISGVLFFFLSPDKVMQFVVFITQGKLEKNPYDFISNYLLDIASNLSLSSFTFAEAYLLSHGIIKLFLVIALLKKRLWAYPWSIAVFTLYIAYQIYRFTFTYSMGLVFLTVFDLIVIWLIWREYIIIRKHLAK